jgi:hypothetical protein
MACHIVVAVVVVMSQWSYGRAVLAVVIVHCDALSSHFIMLQWQ